MAPSRRTDPTPLLQRAAASLRAGDLTNAERACRQALKAAPSHPGGLHLLGTIAKRAGHNSAAIDLFRKAVSAAPRYAEAWVSLGRALLDAAQPGEARQSYDMALAARPHFLAAELGLASALKTLDNPAAARVVLKAAAEHHADTASPWLELGNLLQETAELEEAVEAYDKALARDPNLNPARSNRAAARLKIGDARGALADADAYLSSGAKSANVVAYRVLALQLLDRADDAAAWCDPTSMMFPVRPEIPPTFGAIDFPTALEADIRAHPTLTEAWDPARRAARGGKVTAELMSHPTPAIEALATMIRGSVDELIQQLPDQTDHPFFGAKPGAYSLTIWANILAPGGHQAAHIHNLGWASGVYYPTLPAEIADDSHEGWIAFGEPGYGLLSPPGLSPVLAKPESGGMFIFPSYLWHHTVPLEMGAERISVAFDVVPA